MKCIIGGICAHLFWGEKFNRIPTYGSFFKKKNLQLKLFAGQQKCACVYRNCICMHILC